MQKKQLIKSRAAAKKALLASKKTRTAAASKDSVAKSGLTASTPNFRATGTSLSSVQATLSANKSNLMSLAADKASFSKI